MRNSSLSHLKDLSQMLSRFDLRRIPPQPLSLNRTNRRQQRPEESEANRPSQTLPLLPDASAQLVLPLLPDANAQLALPLPPDANAQQVIPL
jgi:hypothetical protein